MLVAPPWLETLERRRLERRRAALAAARSAAERAEGAGLRLLAFGSVQEAARFRLDSDLDLALDGPDGPPPPLVAELWNAVEQAGLPCDLVWLPLAPARLAARIREEGRDPRDLV